MSEETKPARRQYRRTTERRQEILVAVVQLLSDPDSTGVTTKDIARYLGLADGALYRHFSGKAEILQELIGNLNDMRRGAAHDFLVFGRMQVSCPVRCNHWELHFTGRRSPISLPWVLSSNWSFEERTAQIIVNCNTEKEAVRIEFPDVRRGLLICADGKKSSVCERSLKLEIPGLQPVMIEFQEEEME